LSKTSVGVAKRSNHGINTPATKQSNRVLSRD
jgi:hypothetical protein